MTIRKKAEKEGMEIAKVAALAEAAGIDVSDVDRELDAGEAMRLGSAVKNAGNQEEPKTESGTVLFWSTNRTHIIDGSILGIANNVKLEEHVIRLDAKADADLIMRIRKAVPRSQMTELFEIKDEPFDPESEAYIGFEKMIDELLYTGHTGEPSKMGIKAVRALFSDKELLAMGGTSFDPSRLKSRALRSRSAVRLINSIN